ncbi:MAG: EAL domain-containing protein [Telluria sp.]
MRKTTAIALTLLVATLAVGMPVWLAIHESERQGLAFETERALGYARDIVRRSDSTVDQVASGFDRLERAFDGDPCSEDSIGLMRQIDLSSKYIQAIGFMAEGRLLCSSLGRDTKGLLIGSPDFVTASGISVHKNLRLAFAPQESFIALEQRHFVAIIHKSLPIDITTTEKDSSLAILSLSEPAPMSSRGFINRDWVKQLGEGTETTFLDGGHVVAVVKSPRYQTAAIAAVPMNYLASRTRGVAMRLVPVGVIAGLALLVSVLLLARIQMAIPAAIKAGLKRREFSLLYQPIVDLQSGEWVGAEALIRWQRPAGELLLPDFFIPFAEQNGLIEDITKCVFQLVARDTGSFLKRNPGFHIAINLSAADLHSTELRGLLDRLLDETGALPGNVIVEITERGLLDVDVVRRVLHEVRALGFAIAIDDFGTGYSSLSYLATLEVDYLKIDKSFIDAIATESPTSHVVQHIIGMAKSLRLRMVAEGVTTQEQAQFLRERGVEFAQGWLFGKPVPFAELEQRVSSHAELLQSRL